MYTCIWTLIKPLFLRDDAPLILHVRKKRGFPTILHVNQIKWCGYMYRYYGPRGRSRKYDPPGAVWARRSNPHLVAPRESRPRIGTGNNWTICLFFFPNRILTGRRPRFFLILSLPPQHVCIIRLIVHMSLKIAENQQA